MKTILYMILSYLIFILILTILVGCTTHTTNVISTNRYIQTDYDYDCLDGNKTFSQIIVCLQKQDSAEKAQNKITNDLIKQER